MDRNKLIERLMATFLGELEGHVRTLNEILLALEKDPEACVIAPGTSCRHQIKDLTGRHARHPLDVLAEQVKP